MYIDEFIKWLPSYCSSNFNCSIFRLKRPATEPAAQPAPVKLTKDHLVDMMRENEDLMSDDQKNAIALKLKNRDLFLNTRTDDTDNSLLGKLQVFNALDIFSIWPALYIIGSKQRPNCQIIEFKELYWLIWLILAKHTSWKHFFCSDLGK